jgi:hypothetical protein
MREHDAAALERENRHRTEMAEVGTRLRAEIREIKASRQLAEESVQERFSEIAMLTTRVFDLEARAKLAATAARETASAFEGQVSRLKTKLSEAESLLHEATVRARGLAGKLDTSLAQNRALQREFEAQAQLVAEHRAQLESIHASRAWRLAGTIRKVIGKTQANQPVLEDARQDDQILRESQLFDRTWYHQRYPDVRARKMDPVRHYLQYGAGEGRDPGPAFSTSGYSTRYPDVVAAGTNPLVHYLKYGRKEGRIFSPMEGVIDDETGKRAARD